MLSIIINTTKTRKQKDGEREESININEWKRVLDKFPDKIIIIQKNIEKKQRARKINTIITW